MGTLLIRGGTVLTPFEAVEDGAVLVSAGRIEGVGRRSEAGGPADVEIDVGGRLICPGFVDLQVNGGGGAILTHEPTAAVLDRIARDHVRFGTTSLLATVTTAPEERMVRVLEAVAAGADRPPPGARILGAHLEGLFINPSRKGAHDERFIQSPSRELFERLLAAAGGSLRLITLAPELPGALELIEAARAASIAAALGHTDATYEEALRAIEAGAAVGTHLFNAMRPLAQREPGIVGALLQSEQAVVTIIADGVHVHPAVLELVVRAKGVEKTALVTDALSPAGDAASRRLHERGLVFREGAWYTAAGVLAGSAIGMSDAVRRVSGLPGVSLLDAVRMATATPARVLGLGDEIGALKPGARADIVVCDRDLTIWKVFVGGELAYEAA